MLWCCVTKELSGLAKALLPIQGCPRCPQLCAHCLYAAAFPVWPDAPAGSHVLHFVPGLTAVPASRVGSPIASNTLAKYALKLMREAGVPQRFTCHSCRAAACSEALRQGVDSAVVQHQFRWSTRANTMNEHYNMVWESHRRVAEAVLSPPQ